MTSELMLTISRFLEKILKLEHFITYKSTLGKGCRIGKNKWELAKLCR